MQTKKIVSIIGGDDRQIYLIKHFLDNEYIVKIIGFENRNIEYSDVIICNDIADAVRNTDYIIFGIPIEKNSGYIYTPLSDKKIMIEEALSYMDNKITLFGGKIPENLNEILKKKDNKVYDYCEDDMYAYLNAIPTAEGCIMLIIKNSSITLDGMNCIITGFGRIAKILAYKLKNLGAKITIAARNTVHISEALAYGYDICKLSSIGSIINEFDTVINTVPSMIFNKEIIDHADKNILFIDLASLPGGIDFSFAAERGIKAIQALGLPAKTAPKTAAEIVFKIISNKLEEDN